MTNKEKLDKLLTDERFNFYNFEELYKHLEILEILRKRSELRHFLKVGGETYTYLVSGAFNEQETKILKEWLKHE